MIFQDLVSSHFWRRASSHSFVLDVYIEFKVNSSGCKCVICDSLVLFWGKDWNFVFVQVKQNWQCRQHRQCGTTWVLPTLPTSCWMANSVETSKMAPAITPFRLTNEQLASRHPLSTSPSLNPWRWREWWCWVETRQRPTTPCGESSIWRRSCATTWSPAPNAPWPTRSMSEKTLRGSNLTATESEPTLLFSLRVRMLTSSHVRSTLSAMWSTRSLVNWKFTLRCGKKQRFFVFASLNFVCSCIRTSSVVCQSSHPCMDWHECSLCTGIFAGWKLRSRANGRILLSLWASGQ